MSEIRKIYSASWVVPVSAPPFDDGAVVVSGTRIHDLGPRAALVAKYPEAARKHYPGAVILPGLVNSHSHLELTVMRGFLEAEERDFFAWLRKLTEARAVRLTSEDLYVSALWGAVEAARAGVTCVGDASDQAAASLRALHEVGLRGVVFQEAFGPDPAAAAEQFARLREKIATLGALERDLVRLGVSPHAPYTVSAPLLEMIAREAAERQLPLMMHAAESAAETLFLAEGRGPFAEGLSRRGIAWRAPRTSPIRYLAELGLLSLQPLLAHCVRVDDEEIEMLRASGAKVAHCPKSNAKLRHGSAPFGKFLARGVTVGLGSDSVASNNSCDLLEEARFAVLLSRLPALNSEGAEATASEAIAAATLGGARALALADQTGSLRPGAEADLAIISLQGPHQLPVYDPAGALIFTSSGRDVLLTLVAGREIFRDGHVTTVDESWLAARVGEIAAKLAAV